MRGKRIINAAVVLVVAVLAIWIATAALGDDNEPTTDGPVIAVVDWNSYPAGQIRGQLRLVEGCLLVGNSVVFWVAGTTWDAANKAVEFEDAEPVRVGEIFLGGGGHYSGGNVDGLDGLDVEAVADCLRRTGSDDAVIATPS